MRFCIQGWSSSFPSLTPLKKPPAVKIRKTNSISAKLFQKTN